ncbi:heme lyase CcmF/NrfE family subunit [Hahella sp. SMD15-11]|uniref:Heme lyase CcmF/NrfE family subunit n=1 Tax=Thermohahella caldifontis TaxID=3142973 RepID=A0AB39UY30_9GAMM
MIPELGHYSLVLALALAVLLAVIPMTGALMKDGLWMRFGRPLAYTQLLALATAFAALTWAFLTDDFTVQYVAKNSNSLMPWYYKFSAVWGGHEGSLLLWILILGGWTAAVARFSRALPDEMVARVLSVMGMVGVGFQSFILLTSNPFNRYLPNAPQDGADLNPLLQDIGLIMHPPMLYMGYVGFSVSFAFALAALMGGKLDAAWARWSRPWTTVAWVFLTLGIALGSWWAYYELGWGGWWFWDPVENASFMPWLAGTALVHSLAATEKRGVFKSWTVLLAIFAFSLSLLGTFLVRSGVLTSVHAFASDPERGRFVLMLLAITIGGSLLLYALRAPVVRSQIRFTERSREVFMLVNNILLLVATLTVLGGTLFPLIAEAMGQQVSVGPPYFNTMFALIVPVLVLFMGVGLFSHWKDTRPGQLSRRIPLLAGVAVPAGVFLPMAYGEWHWTAGLGVFIASWLITAQLWDAWEKASGKAGLIRGIRRLSRSYKGMVLAHLGLAMTILGVAIVSNYTEEKDVRVDKGVKVELAGLSFVFKGLEKVEGPNYLSDMGHFEVYDGDKLISRLNPEKRRYLASGQVMTEADIDAGLFRDIYVAMGEPLEGTAWAARLQYKPLVRFLWLGGLLMAAGGVLAISDRRYRIRVKARSAAAGKPEAPAVPSPAVDA